MRPSRSVKGPREKVKTLILEALLQVSFRQSAGRRSHGSRREDRLLSSDCRLVCVASGHVRSLNARVSALRPNFAPRCFATLTPHAAGTLASCVQAPRVTSISLPVWSFMIGSCQGQTELSLLLLTGNLFEQHKGRKLFSARWVSSGAKPTTPQRSISSDRVFATTTADTLLKPWGPPHP